MTNINVTGCQQNKDFICQRDKQPCQMGEMPLCKWAVEAHNKGQVVYPSWYAEMPIVQEFWRLRDGNILR